MPFPSTHPGSLIGSSLNGNTNARSALERFYLRYRPALLEAIGARWGAKDQIEDVFHGFILHVMTNHVLRNWDVARGRFRPYLLSVLIRFLSRVRRFDGAGVRGGQFEHVCLEPDHEPAGAEPVSDSKFDCNWAVQVYHHARELTRDAWTRGGDEKQARFEIMCALLPGATVSYSKEESMRLLGLSDTAYRSAKSRLLKLHRLHLREAVALTVAHLDDVDSELKYLREVLLEAIKSGKL